jgi:hypothetical protein
MTNQYRPHTPYSVAKMLRPLIPNIHLIDGYLLFNYYGESLESTKTYLASERKSAQQAQDMHNSFYPTKFIDEICGYEWELDELGVQEVVGVFRACFEAQLKLQFPEANGSFEQYEHEADICLTYRQDTPLAL